MWSKFVTTWNSTILRRPHNVLSTFLATQSFCWLGLFTSFSELPVGVLPPELAIGMVVGKLTSKFRQPVNLAMAAGIVSVAPNIATMKVTPLITGFVANEKDSNAFAAKRKTLEDAYPFMKSSIGNVEKAAIWIQGPIDKYGLALYLSGRLTGVTTVISVTLLAQYGFDVPGLLADYGLNETALSASVASLAAASVANTIFTPIHFTSAVYGTLAQERMAMNAAAGLSLDDLKDFKKKFQEDDKESEEYGAKFEEETREEAEESILTGMYMALLTLSFITSIYAMKVMGSAGIDTLSEMDKIVEAEESDQSGNEEMLIHDHDKSDTEFEK